MSTRQQVGQMVADLCNLTGHSKTEVLNGALLLGLFNSIELYRKNDDILESDKMLVRLLQKHEIWITEQGKEMAMDALRNGDIEIFREICDDFGIDHKELGKDSLK